MSIDIRAERLIDLDEAAKLFPGRDGGTIHPLTVGLYARRGKKGIRLETVLAGHDVALPLRPSAGSSRPSQQWRTESDPCRPSLSARAGRRTKPSATRLRSWRPPEHDPRMPSLWRSGQSDRATKPACRLPMPVWP